MWYLICDLCTLYSSYNTVYYTMSRVDCFSFPWIMVTWYYFFSLASINVTFLVQILTLFVFVFIQCFTSCKGRLLSGYVWARLQFSAFCYMVQAIGIWDCQICTLEVRLELKIAPDCPQRHTMSALMTSESWSKRNTHGDQLIRLSEAKQPTEIYHQETLIHN